MLQNDMYGSKVCLENEIWKMVKAWFCFKRHENLLHISSSVGETLNPDCMCYTTDLVCTLVPW